MCLSVFEGTINLSLYIDIINESFPSMESLYPDNFSLQQDLTFQDKIQNDWMTIE